MLIHDRMAGYKPIRIVLQAPERITISYRNWGRGLRMNLDGSGGMPYQSWEGVLKLDGKRVIWGCGHKHICRDHESYTGDSAMQCAGRALRILKAHAAGRLGGA